MEIRIFDKLVDDAKEVRTKVFVEEQGFQNEFDEIDSISHHLVMYENNTPIAVGRFYFNDEKSSFVIGRVAVVKSFRKKGLGGKVIAFAETEIKAQGGTSVMLSAQCRAMDFYHTLGYKEFGESYLDEFCPHIWMKKDLV